MGKQDAKPGEFEIKLELPPGSREALERFPALAAVRPDRRREVTRYFDTLDLALARKGFSLRVRSSGNHRIQTLKHNGTHPFLRSEWEWPVEHDRPDISRLAATPLAPRVPDLRRALEVVFVIDIERSTRRLALDRGTEIEAALDHGRIEVDGASAEVNECELELKQGPRPPLYRFAIDLHEAVPMWINPESKAARGYRLRTGESPAPRHAGKLKLTPKFRLNQAYSLTVTANLEHILGNIAAAGAMDIEGIHQLRIGLRRLRSALALFEPAFERGAFDLFARELRRLGRIFGARRDIDVFCTEILPAAAHDIASSWIDRLAPRAEAYRQRMEPGLHAALQSPGFTGLILGLAAWCEDGTVDPARLGRRDMGQPLAKVAPRLLDRMARKVARRSRHIDDPVAMHDFRKSLKKLRYGAEFFAGLYDRQAVKRYRKRCSALQDVLGAINDARVAPRLAAELADAPGMELAPAVATLAAWSAEREQRALAKLAKARASFDEVRPFWR
ncbi:MAG: CYTH and CHAD domain-containing protein [Acetobacteraceae bacterium]|nr:CYTH and CHAD domain-containing protein [Acetobacteraceae bacterium]